MSSQSLINIPRTQKGRITLNNILSAAAQVFYEKGYHSANIVDITKLAGVAAGTFYIYFDGKYSLYRYLLLQCSHQIRRHLNHAIQGCTTRRQVEREGMMAWLEFIADNQYMYHIIWESLYVDRKLFVEYYENFAQAYRTGLHQASEAGELTDMDLNVLAYTLMGASNFLGLYYGLFHNSSREEIRKVVDEYMKILDSGVFRPDFVPPPAAEKTLITKPPSMRFHVEIDEDFFDALKEPEPPSKSE